MLVCSAGRVLKNESIKDAFSHLCLHELGLECGLEDANFVGPFEHFYQDSIFAESVSTHYIVLAYEILVDEIQLDLPTEQHSQYQWFNINILQK